MLQVVLLTKDLFFVPSFRAAAVDAGLEFKCIKAWNDASLIGLEPDQIVAFAVDLSAISLAELDQLGQSMAALSPQAIRCAFGSHVHHVRLEAAAVAGFEPVLSRGQLSHNLPELLAGWAVRSRS